MNRPVVLVVVMALLAGALAFVGTLVAAPPPFEAGRFSGQVRSLASEHRWARVAAMGRNGARQAPQNQEVLLFWALGEERSANPARADEAWERLLEVTQRNLDEGNRGPQQWYYRGWALHGLGDRAGAQEAWLANVRLSGPDTNLYNRACFLSLAGDSERALEAWEELAGSSDALARWLDPRWARVDPDLDAIRGDPRFGAALERALERLRTRQERLLPV